MESPRASFRPPWWATLGTLALVALFVAAGLWQLDRAGQKRALFARFEAGTHEAAIPAPPENADLAALRYRLVTAGGRYDSAHQILLDERTLAGRAGYEVLTPLIRPDRAPAVLVNRGWVPADPDRRRLPDVAVPAELRTVSGLLDRLPQAALGASGASAGETSWPRRMLYPRVADIGAALGYPVEPYQVLLAPGTPDGYARNWRPAVMTASQHVGYALQWFAMAVALVVIYAAVNFRKARVPASRT